jgi:hypothetical protein
LQFLEELGRLQVKPSLTALPTRDCSENKEIIPSSFYQRAEDFKRRIKESSRQVGNNQELNVDVKKLCHDKMYLPTNLNNR